MLKSKSRKGASLIASNMEIVGDLHFQDQLIIDGKLVGNVYAEPDSSSIFTVSRTASVKGSIHVPTVYINGSVEGSVRSDKMLVLGEKAQISGDTTYNFIQVARGAQVDGTLMHISRLAEPMDKSADKQKGFFQKMSTAAQAATSKQKESDLPKLAAESSPLPNQGKS